MTKKFKNAITATLICLSILLVFTACTKDSNIKYSGEKAPLLNQNEVEFTSAKGYRVKLKKIALDSVLITSDNKLIKSVGTGIIVTSPGIVYKEKAVWEKILEGIADWIIDTDPPNACSLDDGDLGDGNGPTGDGNGNAGNGNGNTTTINVSVAGDNNTVNVYPHCDQSPQ